ncbi:WAT1-related protein [Acorus calamus]|uniref:WAT1-related protein n=1 Tax=Acorus calamus TaxID=4465 RepID=A0AAV9ED97_ACOCL|nr:WAT1-related protein [Acorus calamus]
MGTLIGLGGAMLLTFYKGVEINPWKTSLDLLHHHDDHHSDVYNNTGIHRASGNHALGSLLAVASCFSYAIWLIIQAKMIAKYTCLYSATALMCLMASVQGVVYALFMERDWGVWRLGFDIRLLTVSYTGVVATALTLTVMAWCIQKKGPLFASVFNPLMLIIVAVLGSVFLDEKLHLGSILGAVLIVIGLYVVLWGKCKENKQREQLLPVKTPMQQASEIELSEPPDSGTTTSISESDVTVDEAMFTAQVVRM